MPWMMWENVYQSVMCCEFSELLTTPCHSLMYPHRQIGSRPMANSIAAAAATIASAAATYTRRFISFLSDGAYHVTRRKVRCGLIWSHLYVDQLAAGILVGGVVRGSRRAFDWDRRCPRVPRPHLQRPVSTVRR